MLENQTIQLVPFVSAFKKDTDEYLANVTLQEMMDIICEGNEKLKKEWLEMMPNWAHLFFWMENNNIESLDVYYTIPMEIRLEIAVSYWLKQDAILSGKYDEIADDLWTLVHTDPFFDQEQKRIMNDIKTKFPLH